MATQTANLDPTQSELAPALPFRCRSLTINNSTGQYWECFNIPIAAYAQNVTIRIVPTQTPRIIARTPPGFTSNPQPGEIGHVTFSDQDLPISSGVIVTPSANTTGFRLVGSTFAIGAPNVTPTIPTAAQSGDLLIALIGMSNSATNNAPTVTAPAGWTVRANAGGSTPNVGSGTAIASAPFGTAAGTWAGVNCTAIGVTILAFRTANAVQGFTSGSVNGGGGASATAIVPGGSGAATNGIALWVLAGITGTVRALTAPAPTGPTVITQDATLADGGFFLEIEVLQAPSPQQGNAPTETFTWSGNFATAPGGISMIIVP